MGCNNDLDLAALLYLNPELPAYSNVRTVEEAMSRYHTEFSGLPHRVPPLPHGFDAHVYLAAQSDVSSLNTAVRGAMLAEGASEAGLQRGGVYVGTIMQPVEAVSLEWENSSASSGSSCATTCWRAQQVLRFRVLDPEYMLCAGNLSAGDDAKVVRMGTEPMCGRVVEVGRDTFAMCSDGGLAVGDGAFVAGARYTLFGIKIHDAERQARVAYARNVAAGVETPPEDTGVDADFNTDMYQTLYPDVRAFSTHDAYLDYRFRWKRHTDYRVITGDDVFNLRAPFSRDLVSGDLSSVTSLYCSGTGQLGGGNLMVTPCNATLNTDTWVGGTLTAVGGALLGVAGGVAGLTVGPSNVLVQGDVAVRDSLGLGMPAPNVATSGTRLAVDGDIFTTGTMVTQSDARVKTAVDPIQGALHMVGRLRGVTFQMRVDDDDCGGSRAPPRRHTGLLAQDVEAVLPEAVYHRSASTFATPASCDSSSSAAPLRSIAYGNLAGLFTEAIKELHAQLQLLEARVAALETASPANKKRNRNTPLPPSLR